MLLATASTAAVAACTGGAPPPDGAVGTWRLAVVCVYERSERAPCETVPDASAEVLTLTSGLRYTRERPDERGHYAIERRTAPSGTEETLVRFDGGAAAQLVSRGDTLVVSWAYVDGEERRYVRRR